MNRRKNIKNVIKTACVGLMLSALAGPALAAPRPCRNA